ncbi:MAG: DNA cytosine methyltransferase [Alphaproteobacteria bacterium]|nr:MAG: DNA cytosine methyltransferase [Alphaproteobacteria bacterium]
MREPLAVDLFSGAGGLSLGLKAAGFKVAAGVEMDRLASQTYALNNPDAITINDDIRNVSAWKLKKDIGRRISLLAACPPCQGFTSLTSKFRRDDPRNDLPSEVIRFARILKPKAIMFENVPRFLTSARGKSRFDLVKRELEALDYKVTYCILQAADFGSSQFRRRLVVFAASSEIEPPKPTHAQTASGDIAAWRTVKDKIGALGPAEPFQPGKLSAPRPLAEWHVVRRLSDLNQRRLEAAVPDGARWDLPDELRPACHVGSSTGFRNVYGRMSWERPSPTITGGCTSPSKGRFGHPEVARTISVREAGLLQDFPDDYIVDAEGQIDRACEMIGNAFPARLAEAAARQVMATL